MKFDFNLTITSIIALSAIVSPIIVAVINNKNQLKLKQIEFYNDEKTNAINNFIDATLSINYVNFQIAEFYNALNKVSIYVDDKCTKQLELIKTLVEDKYDIKMINAELLNFVKNANK